jgi:hypothetical protein
LHERQRRQRRAIFVNAIENETRPDNATGPSAERCHTDERGDDDDDKHALNNHKFDDTRLDV